MCTVASYRHGSPSPVTHEFFARDTFIPPTVLPIRGLCLLFICIRTNPLSNGAEGHISLTEIVASAPR